jgi:hypothetical protein
LSSTPQHTSERVQSLQTPLTSFHQSSHTQVLKTFIWECPHKSLPAGQGVFSVVGGGVVGVHCHCESFVTNESSPNTLCPHHKNITINNTTRRKYFFMKDYEAIKQIFFIVIANVVKQS